MKVLALAFTLLVSQTIPKNNPTGIWEAETGSQFELRLEGSDLHVTIVPGTNPKFLQYQVEMKNLDEINSYKGTGFFVAKMESGKECKFETEWQLVVVSPDLIIGGGTSVTADKDTCKIEETTQVQLKLNKKK